MSDSIDTMNNTVLRPGSILVIDASSEFLNELKESANEKEQSLILLSNAEEAKTILSDANRFYSAIFINPLFPKANGLELIKIARKHHPVSLLYLIYDHTQPPFSAVEITRLTIHKAIPKPIKFSDIHSLVHPQYSQELETESAKSSEYTQDTGHLVETDFFSVPIEHFVGNARDFFDCYVKLPSNKFIKILNAGDTLSVTRLDNYKNKGVTHLYLKKAMHDRYLSYCDTLANFLLQNTGASLEFKTLYTLNSGELIFEQIKKSPKLDEVHLEYATNFVGQVQVIIKQLHKTNMKQLDEVLHYLPAYENAMGTTFVASLLALPLGMESQRIIETVGVSSFLHDVGLYKLPIEFHTLDEKKMNDVQRAKYQEHVEMGAKILEGIDDIDPGVIQAVRHHHARRNGRGFPAVAPGGINKIGEIIGISDEFIRLLHSGMKFPSPALNGYLERHVFPGYSIQIVEAFKRLFYITAGA